MNNSTLRPVAGVGPPRPPAVFMGYLASPDQVDISDPDTMAIMQGVSGFNVVVFTHLLGCLFFPHERPRAANGDLPCAP